MRSTIARLGISVVFVLLAGHALAQGDKVRIAFNPIVASNLAVFVALEKGYFNEQKIEAVVSNYSGSSATEIARIARGDLDLMSMVVAPGFFNQHAEGFGVKLIASMVETREGWNDTSWIMVRKDIWDSGAIRTPADLRGKVVDGGPDGSPIMLLTRHALMKGGLTVKDVTYSGKFRSPGDWLAAFRNKAADVIGIVDPVATQLEQQGLGHKWLSYKDVMPWFQELYFAASAKFVSEKRDVARRFLVAYLMGAREVHTSGGAWTPELVRILAKWSKLPEEVITKTGGPSYVGQMGTIRLESIERQQQFWIETGMLKEKVDAGKFVDLSLIEEARRSAGVR
jgi:NitT/TauT family transport system substrate-binding protein